jgi:AcrR family transcriptional regulator
MVLVVKNSVPGPAPSPPPAADDVAARIAARTLARRSSDYATEVRRLLDAALQVMAEQGTTAPARVVDIVAAAGLSNDAFYRHFPSKDALVAALLEDGTARLVQYVGHQMDKETTPEGQVRRWVAGVLSQTEEQTAATTRAVLWNGSSVGARVDTRPHDPVPQLAALIQEPFAAMGSRTVALDTALVARALVGTVSHHLWAGTRPTKAEIDQITAFCLGAARRTRS